MKGLKPGDKLKMLGLHGTEIVIEIVDVRSTGYGWKYPDLGKVTPSGEENYWWTENSSDPFLDVGWVLITPPAPSSKDSHQG
jgi:hypothetical protein